MKRSRAGIHAPPVACVSGWLLLLTLGTVTCSGDTRSNGLLEGLLIQYAACQSRAGRPQASRSFQTGFESIDDFSGYYLVPQNYQNAATHELSTAVVRTGASSHRGNIYASVSGCSGGNCNHRGYPTVQLHKRPGSFAGMVFIEFWANLSMSIPQGQWFSLATFSADDSDLWTRTVLVNLASIRNGGNYLHLMHVPLQGRSDWLFQVDDANPVAFPQNTWVKVSVCLDMHPQTGSARVWQNDVLVSSADVRGGCGVLDQAHFGLYASPGLSAGNVYNDDLTIQEVAACPKG